jgi:O-Antigen ligase
VAAAALLAGPVVLAFASGGYGVKVQLLALAAAFCVLGLAVAAAPWPIVSGGPALVAIAALAGLAGWSALSIEWARVVEVAGDESVQALLYAVVFAAAVVSLREPAVRRVVPVALLAGVAVVAAYSLAGRALPDLISITLSRRAGSRLEQPLTYWNALGLLMTFGLLLAAAVASDPGWPRRLRAAAVAAAVPCSVVLYLTFSRGSLLALGAGLVVLFLVRPRRATLIATGIVLAAGVLLALSLQLFPAVLDIEETGSSQTSQGAVLLVLVVALTAAAGFAFARLAGPASDTAVGLSPTHRRVLALGTLGVVLGVSWLVATASEKTDPLPSSKSRLTKLSTNRGEYWSVAVDSFAAHPVTGVGAGSFAVEWRRERQSDDFAQDAHSLYLETLSELGLVGALLLGAFLAAAAAGILRALRGGDDLVAPAAAACLVALLVHVGLDWTWEFPAVTLVALILAAAAAASGRTSNDGLAPAHGPR